MSVKRTYTESAANWVDESANITGNTCGTVGQFVVVGDNFDVQWSAIGDPDDWPIVGSVDARTKQSGLEKLERAHGVVTGIASGDFFGYVFQERAVTKMTYIGGDVVFNFQKFESGRGCFEYNRYVQVDDTVFYQSEFGHHALLDGLITDIGLGFVDDTYTPTTTTSGEYWPNTPSIDARSVQQKNVAVNTAISTVFFEDNKIAYNYKTGQWTLVSALNSGSYFNINSKTGIIGQAVTTTSQMDLETSTSGTAQTGILESGEFDPSEGGRSMINAVRPLTNGGTSTVRVGTRDSQQTAVSYSTVTSVHSRTRAANFRNEGRYHRAEVTIAGGFTTAIGADVEFIPTGKA